MANYGKILGSEAFSKGTDYAARVGAQTRAIETQTSELSKKQAEGMFDLAHKGYQVLKGAQKKKKMFDMLAGSQGYEKQEKRELSFLGNVATLGGAISWGQQDYYSKGEGDDKKFYTREEASENITQSMYDMINKQIANTIETILWFKSQEPIIGSSHEPKEISRISTVSTGILKKNEEKMMFFLDNVTETGYIYSISKQQLESNKNLLKLIKSRVSDDENNKITSSFAVYPSEHKQSFFYSLKYTHHIQDWR